MPDVQHHDRAHAELGASSCDRWWNCPGSIAASRGKPNRDSKAARLGTAAHEVAEMCLKSGQDAVEYVARTVNGIEIDDHTAEKVQVYLDDCREYDGAPEFAWTELRVDLGPLGAPAPMFGIADRAEYFPALQLLKVKDYKNGFVRVSVGTFQPKYYALGVVVALGAGLPVSKVEVTICQPEHGEPKRHTYDAVELAEWSAELMDHARATLDPNAPRHAGPWCKYCPAAGPCAEQARHSLAVAQQEFGAAPTPLPPPDTLTPDALAEVIERASEIRAWLDSVHAYAIYLGGVGDWKPVASEGRSAWRNADEAALALEVSHNIDPWEPRKIASPAQIRGRLASRDLAKAVEAWDAKGRPKGEKPLKKNAEADARKSLALLTYRPSTGVVLVRNSDPRPGIAAAGKEFAAVPLPDAAQP